MTTEAPRREAGEETPAVWEPVKPGPDDERRRPMPRLWAAAAVMALLAGAFGVWQVVRWRQPPPAPSALQQGDPGQRQEGAAPRSAPVTTSQPTAQPGPAETPAARPAAPPASAASEPSTPPVLPATTTSVPAPPRATPAASRQASVGTKSPPADVATRIAAAEEAFGAGDYGRALAVVGAVLKDEPGNQPARGLRDRVTSARAAEVRRLIRAAETSFTNGDYDTAIATLGKALAVDAANTSASELLTKVRAAKAAEERRRR